MTNQHVNKKEKTHKA